MDGALTADDLTSDASALGGRRPRLALVAGALGVALASGIALGHAASSGPELLVGTVAIVSDDGSKACVRPDSGEQWCGRLATSGGETVTVGERVTLLVETVDTDPDGQLVLGTVVPAGFTLR